MAWVSIEVGFHDKLIEGFSTFFELIQGVKKSEAVNIKRVFSI